MKVNKTIIIYLRLIHPDLLKLVRSGHPVNFLNRLTDLNCKLFAPIPDFEN